MTDHALLLVNLGSPASTDVADVRRYLNQFLMDPYVIDLPWPLRRLLVSLILIKRPAASAEAYRSIWWADGSPLVVLSRRLQAKVVHVREDPIQDGIRKGQLISGCPLELDVGESRQILSGYLQHFSARVEAIDFGNAGCEARRHETRARADVCDLGVPRQFRFEDGRVTHMIGEVAGPDFVPFSGNRGKVGVRRG